MKARTRRILLFGDDGYDVVSDQLAGAFRRLGHEAERFLYRQPITSWPRLLHRIAARTPLVAATLKLQYLHKDRLGMPYLKKIESFRPDLVCIVHFNSLSSKIIREIRERFNLPVAWWVMADLAAVSRYDPFYIDLFRHCSHLFVADRSWISTIAFLGEAVIHYLPFAADPSLYFPLPLEKRYDVGMVANFTSNSPTIIHKAKILDKLCRAGIRVRAVTKGIKRVFADFPALRRLDVVDEFYQPPQVNEFYNQTKIMLAINNPQAKSDPAVRVMEIAASGNFQLAEYRENTRPLMGETVVEFTTLDDLVDKVIFYLERPDQRAELAAASRELTLRRHMVQERAREILEVIF